MAGQLDNRRAPRVDIELPCTLRRMKGSPIAAHTLNLGAGGMLVTSLRPLAIDEQIDFQLADLDQPLSGHARVLRQQGHDSYALRFEQLPEAMADCLRTLVGVGRAGPAA
jgi:c-di-GMP-binding flagellar brake protein YcgR